MRKVIPIVPLERLIPKGDYCYSILEEPSPATNYRMRVKRCPFWDKPQDMVAAHGAQLSGYCHYLRQGDWMPDGTFLLWDQVKECGLNYDDHEFGEQPVARQEVALPPAKIQGMGSFEVPLS